MFNSLCRNGRLLARERQVDPQSRQGEQEQSSLDNYAIAGASAKMT
jgi:hypothetical protein